MMTEANGNFLDELQNRLQSSRDLVSNDFVEEKNDEEQNSEDKEEVEYEKHKDDYLNNESFWCSYPGCKQQFYHAPCSECAKMGQRDNCYCQAHESHEVHNILPTEIKDLVNQTQEINEVEIDPLNQTDELKRIENDLTIQSTPTNKNIAFKCNPQQLECYNLLKGIPNVRLNIYFCYNIILLYYKI
jgi:hypothetical protein